jgi:hypothetical protein
VIWVIQAEVRSGHQIWVRFSDGRAGQVDLREMIFADKRPIVVALRDPEAFADLRVDTDTVTWANGFDLAPEYLYANLRIAEHANQTDSANSAR